MENLDLMENFKSSDHLNESLPDEVLVHESSMFLMVEDLLVQVSVIRKLHYQAKTLTGVFEEGFFVPDNVWMAFVTGESYLIEARILTSFKAFCFSFSERLPIFT